MNSRAKGAAAELEWAEVVKAHGYEARRGQQFSGGGDSPDVMHNIPGVHFEVKRTEKLRLYAAVDQARRDAKEKMAVVSHRCNDDRRKGSCKGDWLVVLGAEDYFSLLRQIDAFRLLAEKAVGMGLAAQIAKDAVGYGPQP